MMGLFTLLIGTMAQAAELVPWAQLDGAGPDAVYAETGLEDAFTAGLGYRHVLDLLPERPLVLSATADLPWAELDLADHRLVVAAALPVVASERWMLAGRIAPSWRRIATHMNTMGSANLGLGLRGGFTGARLFVSGVLGIDMALATRIVHADAYRELVYEDAVDGWYKATGARLLGELQVGAAWETVEVGLRVGHARSLQWEGGVVPGSAAVHVGWRL